jgi:hypothetical protein
MASGAATRSIALALSLSLQCLPLGAQEQEDYVTSVTPTSTGAVLDDKIGVDGTLVSESYMLTRLTCRKGEKHIDLMLPITRADSVGQEGSTLRQVGSAWHMTLKAGKTKIDKAVTFVPIADKISFLGEGTSVPITHGDAVWKALIAPGGDKLLALSGGYGEYASVSDDTHLRQFEKICGLKR